MGESRYGVNLAKLREQTRTSPTAAAILRIVEPMFSRIDELEQENVQLRREKAKLCMEIARLAKPTAPGVKVLEAVELVEIKDRSDRKG